MSDECDVNETKRLAKDRVDLTLEDLLVAELRPRSVRDLHTFSRSESGERVLLDK
jgi:hypothetical protein